MLIQSFDRLTIVIITYLSKKYPQTCSTKGLSWLGAIKQILPAVNPHECVSNFQRKCTFSSNCYHKNVKIIAAQYILTPGFVTLFLCWWVEIFWLICQNFWRIVRYLLKTLEVYHVYYFYLLLQPIVNNFGKLSKIQGNCILGL